MERCHWRLLSITALQHLGNSTLQCRVSFLIQCSDCSAVIAVNEDADSENVHEGGAWANGRHVF